MRRMNGIGDRWRFLHVAARRNPRHEHQGAAAEYAVPVRRGRPREAAAAAAGHEPPLYTARPGGPASALAARWRGHRPLVAFVLTTLIGYVLLAAAAIAVGFLLVDVLLPVHAIGHSDEAVNEWLARNRSGSLSDASYVGSSIGDIPFIPGLVILVGLGAAMRRHWRAVGLIVGRHPRRGRDLPR